MTSNGRPGSAPLRRNEEWESYVTERKLFTPPLGVTAPIRSSPVPEALRRGISPTRVSPSEAVSSALEERKRRESLFGIGVSDKDTTSGRGGGGGGGSPSPHLTLSGIDEKSSSWFNSDSSRSRREHSASASAPPLASPTHRRSHSLGDAISRLALPSSSKPPAAAAAADDDDDKPLQSPTSPRPVVLPPQRRTSLPSPPEPRVVTYEEFQERHKAKMKRMQEPVSRAAEEEATLAEARSRWERSKAIEKEVMARRRSEAEAKLRGRGKEKDTERRKSGQERNSFSLERLKGSGLGRMTSSSKVEEWRKYQGETPTPTTPTSPTAGESGGGRHRRSVSGGASGLVAAAAAAAGGPPSPKHRG